ncbi:HD domain-containing protein [Novosphingobium sp. BL-52-GroH]|uniref:HD domain-containing protein n=1 Tax=Novosphingobium sp. BL-52-GroH TaxID=3349877 RepID=UPI0038506507
METACTDLVEAALEFARAAHAEVGQRRKYTGEPYIVHPVEVMTLVRKAGGTAEMQAAALLHDVVEDTHRTIDEFAGKFGEKVALLVYELTEPLSEGNRAARKAREAMRLGSVSPEAQTIKCADLISNMRSIAQHDPAFAKVYFVEKAEILQHMTRAAPDLHKRASALLE